MNQTPSGFPGDDWVVLPHGGYAADALVSSPVNIPGFKPGEKVAEKPFSRSESLKPFSRPRSMSRSLGICVID